MIEALLVFALAIGLGWPLGRYLAAVMRGAPMRVDRMFGWIEKPGLPAARHRPRARHVLARLCQGVPAQQPGGRRAGLGAVHDPGVAAAESRRIPNMRWDTALHTMVSFLTNTNQQHYSGQAQLSYLSQMVGIVGLQVVTPMMGLALVVATLRALMGGRRQQRSAATTAARKPTSAITGPTSPAPPCASCCRCACCGGAADLRRACLRHWRAVRP